MPTCWPEPFIRPLPLCAARHAGIGSILRPQGYYIWLLTNTIYCLGIYGVIRHLWLCMLQYESTLARPLHLVSCLWDIRHLYQRYISIITRTCSIDQLATAAGFMLHLGPYRLQSFVPAPHAHNYPDTRPHRTNVVDSLTDRFFQYAGQLKVSAGWGSPST